MTSRLAEIDHLLARCAVQLKPNGNGVGDVTKVRLLINDLLDERNAITGVPRVPQRHTKACSICYTALDVHRIPPAVVGGVAVDFTNCKTCDRSKCKCGIVVTDITAKKCPQGHWLDRDSQATL